MNAVNLKHRIAELAESQHGLIDRTTLYDLGASRLMVHRWARTGLLIPVGRDAFRLPGTPTTWRQRALAMTMQHDGLVVVSHRSAAALWGMPGMKEEGRIHVTQRRRESHERVMPRIHQAPWLSQAQVREVDAIPVLAPAPLLFQLAATEHPAYVERLVDYALTKPLVGAAALVEAQRLLCRQGRKGTRLFRDLVEERTTPGFVATASELEALFLRIVRQAGLPEPRKQQNVGGSYWVARVDFLYPEPRVVFELDGRRYHTALLDQERDERRDAELVRSGLRVVHLTWKQLKRERGWVVDLLWDVVGRPLAA